MNNLISWSIKPPIPAEKEFPTILFLWQDWLWSDVCGKRVNKTQKKLISLSEIVDRNALPPYNKVHGANTGPTWGRQYPGGPDAGPMNLAIWDGISSRQLLNHRYGISLSLRTPVNDYGQYIYPITRLVLWVVFWSRNVYPINWFAARTRYHFIHHGAIPNK